MQLKRFNIWVLCGFLFIVILVIAGSRYLYASHKATRAREGLIQQQLAYQQKEISELQVQTTALLAANQTVAQQLKDEAAKRLLAEEQNKTAQNKLTQLEQDLEKNRAPDVTAIIKQWRPRIADVSCEWPPQNGKQAIKSGTAVLLPSTDIAAPQLFTSKHVVTYLDKLPELCTLTFPDQSERIQVTGEAMTLSQTKYDWAKITLTNPPLYARLLAALPANRCNTPPSTGDTVLILGYPKIGVKEDITATEGIISGVENNYYITSAKVERGNSGGAAILSKQNCYLGIPTFVDAGQIESLARILDQRVIE